MQASLLTASVPGWRAPPSALELDGDAIHVWRAALDQAPSRVESFLDDLAADERARMARFYFARDRERYIVARGVLRSILGRYMNCAPASLSFRYGPYGKPALAGEAHDAAIRFNVSHSDGIALYAVARGREVGIDLERIRGNLAVTEIAERFFSRREAAMLRSLPAAMRRPAFFRCWTRKEAYIKALGEGLSLPLDQADPAPASRWSLRELTPVPGYVAAVAAAGRGWRLACWQWREPSV